VRGSVNKFRFSPVDREISPPQLATRGATDVVDDAGVGHRRRHCRLVAGRAGDVRRTATAAATRRDGAAPRRDATLERGDHGLGVGLEDRRLLRARAGVPLLLDGGDDPCRARSASGDTSAPWRGRVEVSVPTGRPK
jgi:hypothetical protein